MEKKGVLSLSLVLGILTLNIVSAYGGYGYFSFANFINNLDPLNVLVYGAVFIIIFSLISKGLSRGPFSNPLGGMSGLGWVISGASSFLLMYLLIYRTNFNLPSFALGFGLPTGFLYPLFGIIFFGGALYLIWKMSLGKFLMLAGILIFVLTFTDWIYQKGAAGSLGFVLFLVGFWLWRRKKKGGTLPASAPTRKASWFKNREIKKAEQEAYKEKAKRESQARKDWARESRRLQNEYDKYKRTYQDTSNPTPTRKAAGTEMQRIAKIALNKGLHINY